MHLTIQKTWKITPLTSSESSNLLIGAIQSLPPYYCELNPIELALAAEEKLCSR